MTNNPRESAMLEFSQPELLLIAVGLTEHSPTTPVTPMGSRCSKTDELDELDLRPRHSSSSPAEQQQTTDNAAVEAIAARCMLATKPRPHRIPPRLYSFLLGTGDPASLVYTLRELPGILESIAVRVRRDSANIYNPWWTLSRDQWPEDTIQWSELLRPSFRQNFCLSGYGRPRVTMGPPGEWELLVRLNHDPPYPSMCLEESTFWSWTPESGYASEIRMHFESMSTVFVDTIRNRIRKEWGIPQCLQMLSTEPGPSCAQSAIKHTPANTGDMIDRASLYPVPVCTTDAIQRPSLGSDPRWELQQVQVFASDGQLQHQWGGDEQSTLYVSIKQTGCGLPACCTCKNLVVGNDDMNNEFYEGPLAAAFNNDVHAMDFTLHYNL